MVYDPSTRPSERILFTDIGAKYTEFHREGS